MNENPASANHQTHCYDALVIGSGAAGLTCALHLANAGLSVGVLSKGDLSAGSTNWAQGGIAAVFEEGDSFARHVDDTITAGAGLNDRRVVEYVVDHAPSVIMQLADLGVPFNPGQGARFHLAREGGHSHRRIVHVNDETGHAVQIALETAAKAHPGITLLSNWISVDFITQRHIIGHAAPADAPSVHGVYAYHRARKKVDRLIAGATILATGGASRVYLYSTNPDGATGDGIAMAWRAGCRVANMEFNQFHPTCLYHPKVRSFLITEAMRGEGGILRLPDGTAFMEAFSPDKELAPRDIVARAVDHEMKRRGLDHVLLDVTHLDPDFVVAHFPGIYRRLTGLGIDPTRQPIPVVPAAHYTCGGVVADMDGRTDLAGLYAIGEVAHSGLHGANRMASNSLLECLVFGEAAARDIIAQPRRAIMARHHVRPWDESRVTDSDEEIVVTHNWAELRQCMWAYVGIVRTVRRLERAAHRIALLKKEIAEYYGHFRITPDLIELRNLVAVADLIVRSAQARRESRGLHYILDYPRTLPEARPTILAPDMQDGRDQRPQANQGKDAP